MGARALVGFVVVKSRHRLTTSTAHHLPLISLDSKLKLLHIWRKIGETRPELKGDFERLVTDIGQQLAGAKDSVR